MHVNEFLELTAAGGIGAGFAGEKALMKLRVGNKNVCLVCQKQTFRSRGSNGVIFTSTSQRTLNPLKISRKKLVKSVAIISPRCVCVCVCVCAPLK